MSEFRNPRPAKLGPNNTEFSHNNAGNQNTINPITGEVQINKAPLLKHLQEPGNKFDLITNDEKNKERGQTVFDGFVEE